MQVAARGTSRAAPVGPLAQLQATEGLVVQTPLRLRDHLAGTLEATSSGTVLRSRAGELALREEDVAPVKALLAEGRLTAGDLGLDLARRLLLAGVAVAA
jgi:lysine-specific demethylase/histidyl-hydroxylase NO66